MKETPETKNKKTNDQKKLKFPSKLNELISDLFWIKKYLSHIKIVIVSFIENSLKIKIIGTNIGLR